MLFVMFICLAVTPAISVLGVAADQAGRAAWCVSQAVRGAVQYTLTGSGAPRPAAQSRPAEREKGEPTGGCTQL